MERILTLIFMSLPLLLVINAGAKPEKSPRSQVNFDRNWRFHRGDASEAWKTDFDDSNWRVLDLPHDWAIEDLPAVSNHNADGLMLVPGEWRFNPGDEPDGKQTGFDDSNWRIIHVPANWEDHGQSKDSNVYGWFRRRIEIPAEQRGKDVTIMLGKVDDVDETYVNGVKVGGLGEFPPHYNTAWNQRRSYVVPAHLLKCDGSDVVAVRVFDGEGAGGLIGDAVPSMQSGPFDTDAEGGTSQGFTLQGIGWYRKTFAIPASDRGKHISVAFDGVYMNSTIWLNGKLIGKHPYGYTSFHFDLAPYLKIGKEKNVLVVKVDASGKTSRWYSGAGIYRHVWLTTTGPTRVAQYGVFVTTPVVKSSVATIHIKTNVANDAKSAFNKQYTLVNSLLDDKGKRIAEISSVFQPSHPDEVIEHTITIGNPVLWSPEHPHLYKVTTTISRGSSVVDQVETPFGIRYYSIDSSHGLLLNGKAIKLRGGCVHHDNGCLGSRTIDRAEERRVELLKAAGFNAIRTSHNPPSPAFLNACDRLGMIVMDEAFDCWRSGKNSDDYGRFFDEWWKTDIDSMVLRDRNHPSVLFWSIGNEVVEQAQPVAESISKMLSDHIKTLDTSRPIAQAAMPHEPWTDLDGTFNPLDLAGYNYEYSYYAKDHERIPSRVMVGTESFPVVAFDTWMATIDHPWVIGDFVWTALDYIGEAGLGRTEPQAPTAGGPRIYTVSNCGDLDLDCFRRPQSFYRGVLWGTGPRVVCFVQANGPDGKPERVEGWGWTDERPSWTWPGEEGKPLTVRSYSNYPKVRLLLNGKDLGVKETNRSTRYTAEWNVNYEPGELVAVGLDEAGNEGERWTLRTAGKVVTLALIPDRKLIRSDGADLSFVTVELRDEHGVVNPNANDLVTFKIAGPGRIIGVGNADPLSMESFQKPFRKAYRGRCLVVVQSTEKLGTIKLSASANGSVLGKTEITTAVQK